LTRSYKGKGHKFDEDEAGDVAVEKEMQRMRHEVGAGIRDAGDLVEAESQLRQIKADKELEKEAGKKGGGGGGADDGGSGGGGAAGLAAAAAKLAAAPIDPAEEARLRAQVIAARVSSGGKLQDFDVAAAVKAARLAKIVADLQAGGGAGGAQSGGGGAAAAGGGARGKPGSGGGGAESGVFEEELEINDYPQKARFKLMHRDCIQATQEFTGCAVVSKGVYVAPGRKPAEGERKLYLLIQGATAINVKRAKSELLRVLEEATMELGFDKSMLAGKYSVA
jgi:ATP-dependent RNA helicase DDX46/PRP5